MNKAEEIKQRTMENETNETTIKEDIRIILDYLIENEENHFLENENPKNHIYNNALRVNKWFKGFDLEKPPLCCNKPMKEISVYDSDMVRTTKNCFICLDCGRIETNLSYSLDDDELLSFLESNNLTETKLYKELSKEDSNEVLNLQNEKTKDNLSKLAKGDFKK